MMCAEDEDEEEHHQLLESRKTFPSSDTDKAKTISRKQCPSLSTPVLLLLSVTIVASVFTAGYFNALRGNAIDWDDDTHTSMSNYDHSYVPLLDASFTFDDHTNDNDNDYGDSSLNFDPAFVDYLISGMKTRAGTKKNTNRTKVVQYVYDSPYQERWPGCSQPYWAKKIIPYNNHISSEKQICFVHVGKAGGSTVGCMLGFSLHCSDNDIKGLLPIVTTHTFHRGVDDCADDAAYYLFVVRDPLARMLSDMNYERPDMSKDEPFAKKFQTEKLYQDCNFWTLEDLAQKGLMNTNHDDELSKKCRKRANDAITGNGQYLVHGYFNYQYYSEFVWPRAADNNDASTIPEGANLLVIRNSHMMDDWNSIDRLIGSQKAEALKPSDIPMNNAHAKNATESYLSDSSKIALCQTLCNEIQVYKDIIRRAVNFKQHDVDETMKELRESCPRETAESTCLSKRPDIRHKIESKRGELRL